MIALQAAQDDAGAVLGWDGLVTGLMSDDRLIKLVPEGIASPYAFISRCFPAPRRKPGYLPTGCRIAIERELINMLRYPR